jgi:hypothetical protein
VIFLEPFHVLILISFPVAAAFCSLFFFFKTEYLRTKAQKRVIFASAYSSCLFGDALHKMN